MTSEHVITNGIIFLNVSLTGLRSSIQKARKKKLFRIIRYDFKNNIVNHVILLKLIIITVFDIAEEIEIL